MNKPIAMGEWNASDGPYLSSSQIAPYGAVMAIIERADRGDVAVSGTSRKESRFVLFFKGWKKGMVMSARCNRTFLSRLYPGKDTRAFIGKPVWLYVDPNAKYAGQVVGGIRLAMGDAYSGSVPPPRPTPKPRDSQPGLPDDEPPEVDAEVVNPETGEVAL